MPQIHNAKNTDIVVAIDDNAVVKLSRLSNGPAGRSHLIKQEMTEDIVNRLDLLGFYGISNVLSALKLAKYYELAENDIVLTMLTVGAFTS